MRFDIDQVRRQIYMYCPKSLHWCHSRENSEAVSMVMIPLIRQYAFQHITCTLEKMNVNVGRVLAQNGIPDWRHLEAEDSIPLIHFINAFEAGVHATGDDNFGILVSQENNIEKFCSWGDAMAQAITVYDALNIACRLASSQANTIRMWLSPTENGVLFCRKQLIGPADLAPALKQLERYTITLLVNIVRLGAGQAWTPPWACLSVEGDPAVAEWPELENASIEFSAPHSAIFVSNAFLCQPLMNHAQNCGATAKTKRRQIRELPIGRDFVDDLRVLLKCLLGQKSTDLRTVSEVTLISTRTLQRRLSERGCTFNGILCQARYQTAVDILKQSDACISDVSEIMGYENPQHFIRAFRKWCGMTPAKYRELVRLDQAN